MTYTSSAHREGNWRIVQNDQHPGALSQVRRLDAAAEAQREAIAFVAGVDQVVVVVVIRAELEPKLARSLDEVIALRAEVAEKEARALSLRRAIAIALQGDGVTLRDFAVVLEVSYQRVHQLVRDEAMVPGCPDAHRHAAGTGVSVAVVSRHIPLKGVQWDA